MIQDSTHVVTGAGAFAAGLAVTPHPSISQLVANCAGAIVTALVMKLLNKYLFKSNG